VPWRRSSKVEVSTGSGNQCRQDSKATAVLQQWLKFNVDERPTSRVPPWNPSRGSKLSYDTYPNLTRQKIQVLVRGRQWLTTLTAAVVSASWTASPRPSPPQPRGSLSLLTPCRQIVDEVAALAARLDRTLKEWEAQKCF